MTLAAITALIAVTLVAPIILNVAGWRRLTREGSDSTIAAPWRRRAAAAGLAVNSIAVVSTPLLFVAGLLASALGGGMSIRDVGWLAAASVAMAAVSIGCAAVGPSRIRILLGFAGALSGVFWPVLLFGAGFL